MGEVYRARDTRLDRMVAVKGLPVEFSSDEDRLHRFEHEARRFEQHAVRLITRKVLRSTNERKEVHKTDQQHSPLSTQETGSYAPSTPYRKQPNKHLYKIG